MWEPKVRRCRPGSGHFRRYEGRRDPAQTGARVPSGPDGPWPADMPERMCAGRMRLVWSGLRNGPAGDDPSRWLSGDLCDQVVVAVVVQHGDLFSLGYGGDQQVGESDCLDLPVAPERGLDIERAAPVFIVGGEPFVAGVAVGAQFIELCTGPGGPSELELDDAAGGYQSGLDQRAQHHGHRLVPQARQRAGVRQVAGYRCHAERITCSSSRSGRPPETRRCRSLRRAASAATARRAALTVSFLVSVGAACWAAARYSSSTSMSVLAISTSLCRISH